MYRFQERGSKRKGRGVVVDETKVYIEKVRNGMRRKAEGSTVVAWRQGLKYRSRGVKKSP
jgi:uncharacterized protein (AIM24 family)